MSIIDNENTGSSKDYKSLVEVISNRLGYLPGLTIVLDIYSKKKYDKSFIRLILEDLKSAYDVLVDVLESSESAEIILTYILEVLIHDETLINKILSDLKKGKKLSIKELLRSS